MNFTIKLFLTTIIVFGFVVAISSLIDNTSYGFPFWFYKDACSISFNPETGEEFGETSAFDGINLALDIFFAFIISFGLLFLIKKRKQ